MDDRITVRINDAMLAGIDARIADLPGHVRRQEAVRWCIDLARSRDGSPPAENSSDQPAYTAQEERPLEEEVVCLASPALPQRKRPVR